MNAFDVVGKNHVYTAKVMICSAVIRADRDE